MHSVWLDRMWGFMVVLLGWLVMYWRDWGLVERSLTLGRGPLRTSASGWRETLYVIRHTHTHTDTHTLTHTHTGS